MCLLLIVVCTVIYDRLLQARRDEFVQRSSAGDEPIELIVKDYS
ncbi:hypothetical protein [Clavibacter nebraskensis]